METKICKQCLKELPIGHFHKEKKGKDGLKASCKECIVANLDKTKLKKRMTNYQAKIKETGNEQYWNRRAKNANYRAFKVYGITERLTGIELKIKYEQNPICYYCASKLHHLESEIEHVISLQDSGKHHINNISFACRICNGLKHTKSDFDFFKHIESIYHNLKVRFNNC